MRHLTPALFLVFLISAATAAGWAKTVVLFTCNPELSNAEYNKRIASIKKKDVVVFNACDGFPEESFTVGKVVGEGNTTKIFAIFKERDEALRVAIKHGRFKTGESYISYVNATIIGYEPLRKNGVPTVRILRSRQNAFVLVERLAGVDLADFLYKFENFSAKERVRMADLLIEFARKTYSFSYIGDFHIGQLRLNKRRGWVLMDWDTEHEYAQAIEDESAFTQLFFKYDWIREMLQSNTARGRWMRKVYEAAKKTIENERGAQWFGRPRKYFSYDPHAYCALSISK